MTPWTPCTDSLPPVRRHVIAWRDGWTIPTIAHRAAVRWERVAWLCNGRVLSYGAEPTHWMALPVPPQIQIDGAPHV
jgi:hypothetical protein